MRGTRVNFFCCKAELRLMIENIEKSFNLRYVAGGLYSSTNEVKPYTSLLDYADLGIKRSGEHQSEFFIVVETASALAFEKCRMVDGSIKYSVSQLNNPDSIVFHPGGIYLDKFLIHGQVSAIGTGNNSKKLMNAFRKEIKRQCPNKSCTFYFSEGAEHFYNNGVRLITINADEPVEFDLKI